MADAPIGSPAVRALVDLSLAQGNSRDEPLHAGDPTLYEMTSPMSPAVRQAGEEDPALAYLQTLGQDVPREGFIDEATEVIVTFPFAPEAIAAARAEAARGITWQTGFAMIACAIGGAELYRSLFHGAFDAVRFGVGLLFLVLAVLLYRRGKRVDRGPDQQ